MKLALRVTLTTALALASVEALARIPDQCIVVLEARPARGDTSRAPCPVSIVDPAMAPSKPVTHV